MSNDKNYDIPIIYKKKPSYFINFESNGIEFQPNA